MKVEGTLISYCCFGRTSAVMVCSGGEFDEFVEGVVREGDGPLE